MKLTEMLNAVEQIANENDILKPYIVGGLPRDKTMDKLNEIKDIDITTGDQGSISLGLACSHHWPDAPFRMHEDNHSTLQFGNISLDFSNNYAIPNINDILNEMGIENPTSLDREIYSRDFTINTLLLPFDLKDVVDITGKGVDDIKNKILRTPIDPEYTIGYDPRRILRGLKLSLKYGLEILPEVKDAMIKYRGGVREMPVGQIKKQINQMLEIDSEKALDLLTEYKLLPIIPLSKLLTQEITKHRMVQHLLEGGL